LPEEKENPEMAKNPPLYKFKSISLVSFKYNTNRDYKRLILVKFVF